MRVIETDAYRWKTKTIISFECIWYCYQTFWFCVCLKWCLSVIFAFGQTSPVQTCTLTLAYLSLLCPTTCESFWNTCIVSREALFRIFLSIVSLDSFTRAVTFYLHSRDFSPTFWFVHFWFAHPGLPHWWYMPFSSYSLVFLILSQAIRRFDVMCVLFYICVT